MTVLWRQYYGCYKSWNGSSWKAYDSSKQLKPSLSLFLYLYLLLCYFLISVTVIFHYHYSFHFQNTSILFCRLWSSFDLINLQKDLLNLWKHMCVVLLSSQDLDNLLSVTRNLVSLQIKRWILAPWLLASPLVNIKKKLELVMLSFFAN